MDQRERRDSGLRASAAVFLPNSERPLPKVQTKANKYPEPADFDALAFTPSQGICTPSPTNMARHRSSHPFGRSSTSSEQTRVNLSPRWSQGSVMGPEASTTGESLSNSASSGVYPASMCSSPTYPLLYPSPFFWPMPVSPTAFPVQQANSPFHPAMPGSPMQQMHTTSVYPGSPVHSPMYNYQHHSPFVGPGSPPQFVNGQYYMPMMQPPQPIAPSLIQAQHFQPYQQQLRIGNASPNFGPPRPALPVLAGPASPNGHLSGDDAQGQVMTEQHLADALQMVKQSYVSSPPEQLTNLAILMQAYGLLRPLDMSPTLYASVQNMQAVSVAASGTEREDLRMQASRNGRRGSPPKIGPDGLPKLNARQRRTLRRAHKRAQDAVELLRSAAA